MDENIKKVVGSTQNRAAIEAFYDQFSRRRLSKYRSAGNARIDAAIGFIEQNVRNGQVIVDIGCGVGIVTEALARRAPDSRFIGIDISGASIREAREMVRLHNVEFVHASMTGQADEILSHIGGPVDVMCMVDAIEHFPEPDRQALFAQLSSLASEDCTLLLAYPSPEYQRHLMANDPAELQIVDNVIEIDALVGEALVAGWKLRSFRYVDVWSTNQYIHAAFVRNLSLKAMPTPRSSMLHKGLRYFGRNLFG